MYGIRVVEFGNTQMIKKKIKSNSDSKTSLIKVAFIGSNASLYREVIDVLYNGEGLGVPDENIPIPEEESGLALKEESFTQSLTVGERTIQGKVYTPIPLICVASPDSAPKPPSYYKSIKDSDADVFVICVSSPSGNWGVMQSEALEYSNDVKKYHPKGTIVLAQINPQKNAKDNSAHVCKLIGAVKYLEICIFTSTNLQVQNFFYSVCHAGIKDSKIAESINQDWLYDLKNRVEFTKNASNSNSPTILTNTSTTNGAPFYVMSVKISMKNLAGKYTRGIECELRAIIISGSVHVVAYTKHHTKKYLVINRTFTEEDTKSLSKEIQISNKTFVYWRLPPNGMKLALKFESEEDVELFKRNIDYSLNKTLSPINLNPPTPPPAPKLTKLYNANDIIITDNNPPFSIFFYESEPEFTFSGTREFLPSDPMSKRDDMIWEIFSRLDALNLKKVGLVCKWWSNTTKSTDLRKKVIEHNYNKAEEKKRIEENISKKEEDLYMIPFFVGIWRQPPRDDDDDYEDLDDDWD